MIGTYRSDHVVGASAESGTQNPPQSSEVSRAAADPIDAPRRYEEILDDLLARRAERGGALSDDDEARIAAELDALWWQMTEQQQEELERRIELRKRGLQ